MSAERSVETLDANGIVDLASELRKLAPSLPLSVIIDRHFRSVCIKSLLDWSLHEYLDLESFCKDYGCLPFEGSMSEQPNIVIEAFNTIRAVRGNFELEKQKEIMAKVQKTNTEKSGVIGRKR